MKIGILSDIHSNIDALNAVLEEFEKREVDRYFILGDTVGIGLNPKECMDKLLENREKILSIVNGNHENYLLNGLPKTVHNIEDGKPVDEGEIKMRKWNYSQVSPDAIAFLRMLPERAELGIMGKKIAIEHYPFTEKGKYSKFFKVPTLEDMESIAGDDTADIVFFGHTHEPVCLESKTGKIFINPGSVGCPIATNSASCGILEIDNDKVLYEHLDVEYDIENVIKKIKKKNYPKALFLVKMFYKA